MSADLPLVSVITPCFNHGEFLTDALNSIKDPLLSEKRKLGEAEASPFL